MNDFYTYNLMLMDVPLKLRPTTFHTVYLRILNMSKSNINQPSQNPANFMQYPIRSMYGLFTYIYHKIQPNVGK